MDSNLRPDLSKILHQPLVLRSTNGIGTHLNLAHGVATPDYLIDVRRSRGPAADETGFGLSQAHSVAQTLATRLRQDGAQPVHLLDRDRLGPLLD